MCSKNKLIFIVCLLVASILGNIYQQINIQELKFIADTIPETNADDFGNMCGKIKVGQLVLDTVVELGVVTKNYCDDNNCFIDVRPFNDYSSELCVISYLYNYNKVLKSEWIYLD